MSDGLADLLHDAAVLYGFVDFLEEYCREQERSQTYVDASGLFFHYVKDLAAGIKEELGREINRATRFPTRLPVLQRNILTLKYYLQLLHEHVKPAADAHTLTIPAPLIHLASQQLQRVEGMRTSKIVILLTPEFMYFQRPHTYVKEQARLVQAIIPQATFPAKLGFIALPYSQGPSFFTNLAIYHEIGHFVYEELSKSDPPHPGVATLRSVTNRSLRGVQGSPSRRLCLEDNRELDARDFLRFVRYTPRRPGVFVCAGRDSGHAWVSVTKRFDKVQPHASSIST